MTSLGPPNNEAFLGYYMVGGTSPSATNCGAGSFVTTSGTYVDCCASASTSYGAGGCLMRISCIDSTRLFALPTATRTCVATGAICHTQTIFQNYPGQGATTKIVCGYTNVSELTLYRNVPAPKTTGSSTTGPSSTRSITPTPVPSTIAPGDLPVSTSPPALTSEPKQSKAWIAGVVIGPIALIVVAALILYICMMKKKHKRESQGPVYPPEYKAAIQQSSDPIQQVPLQHSPHPQMPVTGYHQGPAMASYPSQDVPFQQTTRPQSYATTPQNYTTTPQSYDNRMSGFSSYQVDSPQQRHELPSGGYPH